MDTNTDIIDFMDLINFTLSDEFVEKWRHKYSEGFIRKFQLKILETMNSSKPIKINTFYTYLTNKCKYSDSQVISFFKSIDIDLYQPLVSGSLSDIRL